MANFDAYPAAALPLSGAEVIVIAQRGNTVNVTISQFVGQILFSTLPTSDPHIAGQLWNNGGVVCVSFGP